MVFPFSGLIKEMTQDRNNVLSWMQGRISLPWQHQVQAPAKEDRIYEVSVAGKRVVCALKHSISETSRRDDRRRIRLELVDSMLGFLHQARLYSRALELNRSLPPQSPPVEGGGLIPLLWREGLGVRTARTGTDGPNSTCGSSEEESHDEGRLSQVRLSHDALGRPFLFVGSKRGPSVSFSYSHGVVWGALCEEGPRCGIDSARGDEFAPGYPFDRAFNEEEFAQAITTVSSDCCDAAAALWSAKEAVVKAIGCGFNLIDPLEVTIRFTSVFPYEFEGHGVVNEQALSRVPLRGAVFPVRTFRYAQDWVSVAVAPLSDG